MDLSFLDAIGRAGHQRAAATRAALNPVPLGTIGLLDHRRASAPNDRADRPRGARSFPAGSLGAGFWKPSVEGGLLLLREFLAS